jgi:hypothetical protein
VIIHAPFPVIFKETVLLAVFTTRSLLFKTSNSMRLLCECVKQLLAPLSAIILILSWVLHVLHFSQFDKFEEQLLLQKSSTLLCRLLKLLNSCDFPSLVRVQTVKLTLTYCGHNHRMHGYLGRYPGHHPQSALPLFVSLCLTC